MTELDTMIGAWLFSILGLVLLAVVGYYGLKWLEYEPPIVIRKKPLTLEEIVSHEKWSEVMRKAVEG